ncbi:MAG TPA: TolC family protein [Lacunisphaera sp.]
MKFFRLFLAVPFMVANVWAQSVANELVLPEKLLPELDGILKTAVQQSPAMLNRALDLEVAEAGRIQARSNLLPSLSGSISYYKSNDTTEYLYSNAPASNSSNSYLVTKTPYALTLSQPVFYWGQKRNYDRIGAIQLQMAKGQYRDGYRQLAQQLRGGYMALILQKIALKRAQFYLQYAQSQLKEQEDRLLKKEISDAQIFTARMSAEQAQIAADRAEYDYTSARASFGRLAGIGEVTDASIPDAIPAATYDAAIFDHMLADFVAQKDPPTSEAEVLRQQIKVENLNLANAKIRLRPTINATFGVSKDQQNNLYGQGLNYSVASIYGGFSLNWAIFDGFATRAAVRSTLAGRRRLENNYLQVTERLVQDAQTQVKLINFAARNMVIYDRLLVSNTGYLQTARDDFKRGVKSEAEVSQIQLSLYDAQINAANTRSDYLMKVGDFLGTVVGDPAVANLPQS